MKYAIAAGLLAIVPLSSMAQMSVNEASMYPAVSGSVLPGDLNFEDGVLGVTADSGCTLTSFGPASVAWASPSLPVYLNPGDTATVAPATDGTSLSIADTAYYTTNPFNLRNISFRNVIRGVNMTASGKGQAISIRTGVDNVSQLGVVILGPNIGSGITGATHFSWKIRVKAYGASTYTIAASGSGEWTGVISVSSKMTVLVDVSPTDNNEVGSVMVNLGI